MATQQIRTIRVVADVKGEKTIKQFSDQFAKMNKTIDKTGKNVNFLKNAFVGLTTISFAGMGIRDLTNMMDSYQKLSDRINIFSGSAEKGALTMERLVDLSAKNKTTIESTATVFSRLALSLQDVGISTEGVLMMTENLQNTFRLSGATIAEATGATIQLSQGLASGTLRGQELRAVLEANAIMGEILAEEFNTTRGQLMKLGEAGKITSDRVFSALLRNTERLTTQAEKLTVTFSEANERGLMRFTVALGELNKQYELSTKYDRVIQGMADNWKALAAVFLGLATTTIPLLIAKIKALAAAMMGATLSNPITALVAAIVAGTFYVVTEWEKWEKAVLKLGYTIHETLAEAGISLWNFVKSANDALGSFKSDSLEEYANNQKKYFEEQRNMYSRTIREIEESAQKIAEADKALASAGSDPAKQLERDLRKLQANNAVQEVASLKKQLEELNNSYNSGSIGFERYNKRLRELTQLLYSTKQPAKLAEELFKVDVGNLQRSMEHGAISVEKFNSEMEKLSLERADKQFELGQIGALEYVSAIDKARQASINFQKGIDTLKLRELQQAILANKATMEEYRQEVVRMNQTELNAKLKAQMITIEEYNNKMVELSGNNVEWKRSAAVGLENYLKDAENFNAQFSKVVTSSMGHLEDAFVEFTESGKFSFKDMAESILKDLNRVIMRAMIMAPILRGIQSGMGLDLGSVTTQQADGGGWNKGVQFFAKGGVVNSPTLFGHSGGVGIMGEAGPEAIMPLQRGKDGKLGVRAEGGMGANVIVNVVNNSSDSQVEQRESQGPNGERQIDVLIVNKVKEALGNGTLDSSMKNNYGLNRRGM